MSNKKTAIVIFGCALGLVLLAACSPAAPTGTATLDLNPFRTEVAATVLAQVSQTQASLPSLTPTPNPTATFPPLPTFTSEASPGPTLPALPTIGTPGTPGTPSSAGNDRAQWVSQTIADDTNFIPGEVFTMTWRVKNVGTSTWTAAYWLRFYSGDPFGAPKEAQLGQVVPPGAEVSLSLPMKAPVLPGDYRSDWVLSNETRRNFKDAIFLKIRVVNPVTPTPSPTATPRP